MSGTDHDGEVVDTADGVTLRKRFEEATGHLPAVTYELSSEREDPVTVRVIDPVPDGLEPGDVGFFSSDEPGSWQREGPKLVLRVELESLGEFTTACAARGSAASAIEELLESPQAFDVESAAEPAVVHEKTPLIARSPEEARSDEESTAHPQRVVEVGEGDSQRGSDVESGRAESNGEASDEGESGQQAGVVDRFVTELRDGSAAEESVAFLREHIGSGRPPRRSVEARLEQLQTDLADVRAYSNTLEDFLDEGGTERRDYGRLEARLESLDETVQNIQTTIDALDEDLAGLREEVEALAPAVQTTSADFEELSAQVSSLEANLERFDDRLPAADVDERFAEIEAKLDDVAGFTDSLRSVFEN